MRSPDEILSRISRKGEAVFAMDAGNRIIHWNKACEALLGLPAKAALGKPCYQVLEGRDANGNDYCQRSCPVAHQARETKEHPVCRFELSVRAGDGERKQISTALFSLASSHPALATLVHVCRESVTEAAENRSEAHLRETLEPVQNVEGESIALTSREMEVLEGLGKALSTDTIAALLLISVVTVRNHIAKIFLKLDVHTKLEAVVFAQKSHLIRS